MQSASVHIVDAGTRHLKSDLDAKPFESNNNSGYVDISQSWRRTWKAESRDTSSQVQGGIGMPKKPNRLTRWFPIDVGRSLLKVFLVAVLVAATAGAGGSFSFNICPSCAPYRLDEPMVEEKDQKPKSEANSNVSEADLPPMQQNLRGTR
jgi:hypothetical protein